MMVGKITALRFQKRHKDRVNVYVDGQFAFGLAAILAARLQVGQTLSDEDVARLKAQDEAERAYGRALNFLSYRPRSEAEVRRNLRSKGFEDSIVEAVIERLTQVGLLNDREFAHYWVENRLQFRPKGVRALRQELRDKGISASIVDDVLIDVDEEAAARQAAKAGVRRLKHLAPADFRRKLGMYLSRRGFSYAVIRPLVEEMLEESYNEALLDIESEE